MKKFLLLTALTAFLFSSVTAQKKKEVRQRTDSQGRTEPDKNDSWKSATFNGLSFRCIGTAKTSGRVVDFAVNPNNHNEYYVAAASGGVWKTSNAGTRL